MDAVSSALLWVRMPSLPVEFWSEAILREILEPAGELLCIDSATRLLSRGAFARACIRVDLRRPLRPGVRVQGSCAPFWQQFQYENMEGICSCCGSIHLNGPCSLSSPALAAEQPSAGPSFGPWMTVTRRRRPPGMELRKSSSPSGASQDASVNPLSEAEKTDLVAEGWLSPAKFARRKSSKASLPSVSEVRASASHLASLKKGLGPSSVGGCERLGVPVSGSKGSVPVSGSNGLVLFKGAVASEKSEVQNDESELQLAVIHKPKSNNPFALLGAVSLEGSPSARTDANPVPSKRARPEESHLIRKSSQNVNRKGKGAASGGKGAKGKVHPNANLNPDQGPSSIVCRPQQGSSGQVSVGSGSEGQSSQDVNCNKVLALPCLKLAIQGQSVIFGLPADDPRAADDVSEAVAQRADSLSMDCAMQAEVGGTLHSKHSSDSVMLDNQGGLHPSPQL